MVTTQFFPFLALSLLTQVCLHNTPFVRASGWVIIFAYMVDVMIKNIYIQLFKQKVVYFAQ